MDAALQETTRRRQKQLAYNQERGITPKSIEKSIDEILLQTSVADATQPEAVEIEVDPEGMSREEMIARLTEEMKAAADRLEYELAASIRDKILEIEELI
jgi:excinuclease ABC subunit B